MILNFSPNFCKATVNFLLALIFSKYNLGSIWSFSVKLHANFSTMLFWCPEFYFVFIQAIHNIITYIWNLSKEKRETNTCLQLLFELDSLCTWKRCLYFLISWQIIISLLHSNDLSVKLILFFFGLGFLTEKWVEGKFFFNTDPFYVYNIYIVTHTQRMEYSDEPCLVVGFQF